MKKKGVVFGASYLGVAGVWLGGHFGPGFATGAFSVQYFIRYGFVGLFMPLIAMLVTGLLMYVMVEYARSHKITNYRPFALTVYGKKFGNVMSVAYDCLFLAMVFCAGGLAFSGEANVLANVGFNYWAAAILIIAISIVMCLFGSKILSRIAQYMMYAIIAVVVLIVILSFVFGDYNLSAAVASEPVIGVTSTPTLLRAIGQGILYGCFQSTCVFNVMAVSNVLKDKKGTRKFVIFGYIITVFLMIMFALTLFSYITVIPDLCDTAVIATPIMAILNRLGFNWLTWLFIILMTLAVLTTTAGLSNASFQRFSRVFKGIKNDKIRRAVIILITLAIAAIGASFGMRALLQKGTTWIGYATIVILIIPAFFYIDFKLRKEKKMKNGADWVEEIEDKSAEPAQDAADAEATAQDAAQTADEAVDEAKADAEEAAQTAAETASDAAEEETGDAGTETTE